MRRLSQEQAEKNVLKKCTKNNYELIEKFIYINKNTKIILKCNSDDYIWKTTYTSFIRSTKGCPKCGGYVKLNEQEIKNRIINLCDIKGYDFIEPLVYKNEKIIIHLKCKKDNYEWDIIYENLIYQNNGCPKCNSNPKLSQEEAEMLVKNKCKEKKCKLLNNFTYSNSIKTILKLQCNNCGHEWNIKFSDFIYGHNSCSKCAKNRLKTQYEAEKIVNDICISKNYKWENFTYINNQKTILHLNCNVDGYKWKPKYADFVSGRGCPKCSGKLKITQEEANELVLNKCKERNYILVESFIYINNKSKMRLKCNNDNHEWFPTYNNFIHNNSGCSKCKESHGETEINKILINKKIKFIREYKFEKCKYKKKLKFDFYLPEQNICIEFDGEQHFHPKKYWGGEEQFEKVQIRDSIKTKYCLDNNIKLIRIRYDENIEEKLKKNLN